MQLSKQDAGLMTDGHQSLSPSFAFSSTVPGSIVGLFLPASADSNNILLSTLLLIEELIAWIECVSCDLGSTSKASPSLAIAD
jgi:hypothetical protein